MREDTSLTTYAAKYNKMNGFNDALYGLVLVCLTISFKEIFQLISLAKPKNTSDLK